MPIKSENRDKYPADWKAISQRIRVQRAKGQCECRGECGLHHGRRCAERNRNRAMWAKGSIVLTADCRDENLKAMCQRCHLRYDAGHHQANARETRRNRKAIGDLL